MPYGLTYPLASVAFLDVSKSAVYSPYRADRFGVGPLSSVAATWDVVQKDRCLVEGIDQGLCRNAVQLLAAKDGMIGCKR